MNIKRGQGFKRLSPDDVAEYGLILNCQYDESNHCIGFDYVEVFSLYESSGVRNRCYDDVGATDLDKDNVGLKHTFDVFTEIRDTRGVDNNTGFYAIAIADMSNVSHIFMEQFRELGLEIIDDGRTIDDRDMYEVEHHGEVYQRELHRIRVNNLSDRFSFPDVGDDGCEMEI